MKTLDIAPADFFEAEAGETHERLDTGDEALKALNLYAPPAD